MICHDVNVSKLLSGRRRSFDIARLVASTRFRRPSLPSAQPPVERAQRIRLPELVERYRSRRGQQIGRIVHRTRLMKTLRVNRFYAQLSQAHADNHVVRRRCRGANAIAGQTCDQRTGKHDATAAGDVVESVRTMQTIPVAFAQIQIVGVIATVLADEVR